MRLLPFLSVPVVALSLTACSVTSTTPAPVNTSSAETPAFATDEEALAAAQAAYAEYLQVSDQIARDGGANPERLSKYVSNSLFDEEIKGFQEIQTSALKAIGNSKFDTLHLQSNDGGSISTYLCIDHSMIRIFDTSGTDVTNPTRSDRIPLVVTFQVLNNDRLIIEKSETWSGENYC